ncbi:FtsX-like permease family protein [candidate division KSB1 bacterium]|nr:FtsX-like permease family protein [candidate division KSB1 bacterium]
MIIPRLALRNLLGAGIRTWLNVVVLSFAFVSIIWSQGLLEGMNKQAADAMIHMEYGNGQYWHANYDRYDPLTLEDAHGAIPPTLQILVDNGKATPILITFATMYPNGRLQTVLLKGIDPNQSVMGIPGEFLAKSDAAIPALIGARMAKNTGLKIGDIVTIQWRDVNGTYDAQEATIVQVMTTSVQSVDNGTIWLPLKKLQNMTGMIGQATIITLAKGVEPPATNDTWQFENLDCLLKDLRDMVKSKSIGSSIMYIILLLLAMLAIFDTQVLSIFRRRKEMGTLMALGLTRVKVIQLFTLEGALHSVLAVLVGALYGTPLLALFAKVGWSLPENTDSYGFAIGDKLFPSYSLGLVVTTTILVMIVTTIVSFLPARRIAKLKPTEALRGRMA